MTNIAIFASGSGSNAENISKFFENTEGVKVKFILSNKADAFVLERAKRLGIKAIYMNTKELNNSELMLDLLKQHHIDLIVLAGYLKLIPKFLIEAYPNKIINIHPALLPKYGGKGMYGMHVHEAVVAQNETETGITIHYVNENYDEGNIIAQFKCSVEPNDTPEDVATKIHRLEMENFPKVIESLVQN